MAGPTPYAGTPFALPTDGAWRQTPFLGSPIFADLDGNGTQELITPAAGGRLLAYTADPKTGAIRLFQSYNTGSQANFKSTPAVIDTPTGKIIVAALGRDESNPNSLEDGRVFAFNALTGAILPGWPQNTDRPPPDAQRSSGVTGAIATGDLNGDGIPEIVVTSFSTMVTAFKLDGTKLWQFANDETVEPGAVIADLNRDGKNEVIYTSGISPSPYYPAGGMITILNGNNGSIQRRIFTGEVFFGAPVVADLNGDGKLEIIAATGPHFNTVAPDPASQAAARAAGNRVYAFDYLGQPRSRLALPHDHQRHARPPDLEGAGGGRPLQRRPDRDPRRGPLRTPARHRSRRQGRARLRGRHRHQPAGSGDGRQRRVHLADRRGRQRRRAAGHHRRPCLHDQGLRLVRQRAVLDLHAGAAGDRRPRGDRQRGRRRTVRRQARAGAGLRLATARSRPARQGRCRSTTCRSAPSIPPGRCFARTPATRRSRSTRTFCLATSRIPIAACSAARRRSPSRSPATSC